MCNCLILHDKEENGPNASSDPKFKPQFHLISSKSPPTIDHTTAKESQLSQMLLSVSHLKAH